MHTEKADISRSDSKACQGQTCIYERTFHSHMHTKHMFIKSLNKAEVYSHAQSREQSYEEQCVRQMRFGQMKSGGLEFLESPICRNQDDSFTMRACMLPV